MKMFMKKLRRLFSQATGGNNTILVLITNFLDCFG